MEPKATGSGQGFGAARCERSSPREDGSAHPGVAAPLRPQMDLGKDEGSLPQPTRKKFVIPLEDEAPPAGVRARAWGTPGV